MSYPPDNISAVLVVWGESFIKNFLNYGLPSLLSDGNLPYLKRTTNVLIYLYTPTDEYNRFFLNNLNWLKFESQYHVVLKPLEELQNTASKDEYLAHNVMMLAHNDFGKLMSSNARTALIFLGPDAIYSSDFFKFCLGKINEGFRAIMYNALKVEKTSLQKEIDENAFFLDENSRFSASRLIELFDKYEHPVVKSRYPGEPCAAKVTSVFLWKDAHNNRVLRSVHWHPVLIWPEVSFDWSLNNSTIDTHYCQSVVNANSIYFQLNMQDFLALDLSDEVPSEGDEKFKGRVTIQDFANCIGKLCYHWNWRVFSNIMHYSIIPSKNNNQESNQHIARLITESFLHAQILLDAFARQYVNKVVELNQLNHLNHLHYKRTTPWIYRLVKRLQKSLKKRIFRMKKIGIDLF